MDTTGRLLIDIDSLSYGRAAVGRSDGRVVFVEQSAPGDRVRARVAKDHGRYLEARLEEVVIAGPNRVDPPCPLVTRCGGCPWQHVDYNEQLRAKRRAVIDAFERIAGIANPCVGETVPSPATLGYRNRLKLRFEEGRLGFYSARSHRLIPIADCLLGDQSVRSGLADVEAFVGSLATRATRVEIASRGEMPGLVVAINSHGRLRRSDALTISAFVTSTENSVAGVVAWGKGWRRQWGDTRRSHRVDATHTRVETHAATFGQINTEANLALVAAVLAATSASNDERIVDLYAGAGNFALPLARCCRTVTAVESDAIAVEAGRASARSQDIRNVDFRRARVEDFLTRTAEPRPDRVVVNPPRSGLGTAAGALGRWRAPALTYVSCNAATLARDVSVLAKLGYTLVAATPFDLFPQSFHVETVCDLRLT